MAKLEDKIDDLEREVADLRAIVDRMYMALKQRHIINENHARSAGPSAPPPNIPPHVRSCW